MAVSGPDMYVPTPDDEDFFDLGDCPYYARWCRAPGFDPEATCAYSCVDEPECVTCRPREGWAIESGWADAEAMQHHNEQIDPRGL